MLCGIYSWILPETPRPEPNYKSSFPKLVLPIIKPVRPQRPSINSTKQIWMETWGKVDLDICLHA